MKRDPDTRESDYRVVRGGGWFSNPKLARFAYRGRDSPGPRRRGLLGLRLVKTLDPSTLDRSVDEEGS